MPNTNCLEGIKCPKCGQEDRFIICVSGAAVVTDDGIEQSYDSDWDNDSFIMCHDLDCEHEGKIKDFTAPATKEEIAKWQKERTP